MTTSVPHLSTDLRLACLRIARRNRFESVVQVPPHQAAVLVCIQRGAVSAGEIAEREKISAPTVSRTITSCVDAGWVSRAGNPEDGRRIILSLTEAGRRALEETVKAREEWMSSRLKQLTAEEIALLEAALPVLERVARL